MISSGNGLTASWAVDWVGEWNLGAVDQFEPCNFEGVGGQPRSVRPQPRLVRNDQGHARRCRCSGMYYRWIHNYHYGRNW